MIKLDKYRKFKIGDTVTVSYKNKTSSGIFKRGDVLIHKDYEFVFIINPKNKEMIKFMNASVRPKEEYNIKIAPNFRMVLFEKYVPL